MSQNGEKNQNNKKKPIFLRGLKPSTDEWLDRQKDRDAPSRPAVVRRIIEEERRRQEGEPAKKKK